MNEETMTDALAVEVLERRIAERHEDCKTRKALEHAAARLRGEAAQGEQKPFGHYFSDDPKSFAMPGAGFKVGAVPPADAVNVIALYTRPQPAAVAGDAVQSDFVTIESHWLQTILSAAALLEGTGSILDKREAEALRKMAKSAKPAAPAPVAGDAVAYWLAVDSDGTVNYGLTTADANDGEASRQQVNDFINETDPSQRIVGVAALAQDRPVAGDAVRKAAAALLDKLVSVHGSSEYQAVWQIAQLHRGRYTGPKYDEEMTALEAALAQDRAAQGGAAGVPDAIELLDVPALPSDWGSRNGYKSGWNDCRAAMLAAAPTPDAEGEVGHEG
ncbi:hypothetical protein PQS31_06070 [Luteimonas sp BLCC-B24]|uniref:hypothetical protein n=1 Tax=Luteimonas sp. BLCC-B24 TaxID=3025317 RepID=UPI00234E2706|nr:hypothetical protein [Luteimonas sp. BLCC-B24]MDC7806389.1 hypothetical protein [Luteimonas sp. BLCC-B24]